MLAERLGSPMTSIMCVGAPIHHVSERLYVSYSKNVPEKGLLRTIWNSPEGGGATIRGILIGIVGWFEKC
jgi:hypothetical protein